MFVKLIDPGKIGFPDALRKATPEISGKFGGTVTVIYSAPNEAPRKSRTAFLPLLIVLFIFSYAILTLLVVEQGRTIESQRGLLREMLKDSNQLMALKERMAHQASEREASKPATRPQQTEPKSGGAVSASPKVPAGQASNSTRSTRTTKQVPVRPVEDVQDARRTSQLI